MDVKGVEVKKGEWLVANCGKVPSERNCQLVIMAPSSQREDLLNAAIAHAVKDHGHEDTPELRSQLGAFLDRAEI